MIQKKIRLLILGLLLPLVLLACTPEVRLEGAARENQSSTQTAVPPTAASTTTATAVPASPTPVVTTTAVPQAPLPRASQVPDHPGEPTPLPTASLEIEIGATTEVQLASPPAEEPTLQPALQAWVDLAKEDLAQRLDLPLEEIDRLAFEFKEWPDGSLGCPQPGMNYTQVPQDGYLIRLQAGDKVYNYHGGRNRDPFLCLNSSPQPEIVLTMQPPLDIKEIGTKIVPPPRD